MDAINNIETLEPLTENDLRLDAVKRGDVKSLQELADTTEWIKYVEPKTGNTLLHFAIEHKKPEVCEYLLSTTDCPLDHKSSNGKTPLSLCLEDHFHDNIACEIVKKGASLDCVPTFCRHSNDTLLHYTAATSFVELSKLLMEMGHDVNARNYDGETPLWSCLRARDHDSRDETILALVCSGADTTMRIDCGYDAFEYAIDNSLLKAETLQFLFHYMFDEYTSPERPLGFLLFLAYYDQALFHTVVQHTETTSLRYTHSRYHELIFFVDVEYLNIFLKNFSNSVREVIVEFMPDYDFLLHSTYVNLAVLLESDLKVDVISMIAKVEGALFGDLSTLRLYKDDESVFSTNLCFLLSYGFQLVPKLLHLVYARYGYGELLKILLHMDVPHTHQFMDVDPFLHILFAMPFGSNLVCRTHSDVEIYRGLRRHFTLEPLHRSIAEAPPPVPLLLELSRDVFRKFLAKTFEVKDAKQFYTLVNHLDIATVYKKIITLERPLYPHRPALYLEHLSVD